MFMSARLTGYARGAPNRKMHLIRASMQVA
jgi:hypothetical protein